jgi:hypothetical protein
MRPLAALAALAWATMATAAPAFDFERDTFAFPNETYRIYDRSPDGRWSAHPRAVPTRYSRSCLVLARAALQFHKFARFDPAAPPPDAPTLRRLVRRVARTPAWLPPKTRVTLPGFPNLHALSRAHPDLLRDELGRWWPTYIRPGNWRSAAPFPRSGQARLARQLAANLARHRPSALFLTRGRPMNHAVVAFATTPAPDGAPLFHCYDPNNPRAPLTLRFDPASQSFLMPRTPYWTGGPINVFPIYTSPFQ